MRKSGGSQVIIGADLKLIHFHCFNFPLFLFLQFLFSVLCFPVHGLLGSSSDGAYWLVHLKCQQGSCGQDQGCHSQELWRFSRSRGVWLPPCHWCDSWEVWWWSFSAQAGRAFYCHKAALPGMGSTSCADCGASRASDGASCRWLAPHLAFWPHRW